MFHLIYVSSATVPFSVPELLDLLRQARGKNAAYGITGMLLYKDGSFMQLLEGEEAAVRGIFGAISRDTRHRGIIVLVEEPAQERLCPDWSMGFRDLAEEDVRHIPGFSRFMNGPAEAARLRDDGSDCRAILEFFRDSR